ncbi:tyrosine-type recombinase/integrase [Burkholderiaceae bacterium DAT-1]|nr:tyrosine-type recombinase/integrase [Burkholderiaceae bacterium DAT-1]
MATKTIRSNLLTAIEVKNARLTENKREDWLNDGDGLRLRIRPSGKTWYFVYQEKRGDPPIKLRIGTYPAIQLADARNLAITYRNQRAEGLDPRAEIEAEEQQKAADAVQETGEISMNQLYELYDQSQGPLLDPHNRAVTRSRWKCHVAIAIGSVKVKDANKQPVMAHYNELAKKGKSSTPRAAISLLVRVMKWAEQSGLCSDTHPLLRMQVPVKTRTTNHHQAPETFNAAAYLEKHGKEVIGQEAEDDKAGRALQFHELVTLLHERLPKSTQALTGICMMRFMLATGIRASETIRIRWAWIVKSERLLIIPSGSMKKRRMHHVYLSDFAMKQLEIMEAQRLNDFVFPAAIKENAPVRRDNVGTDIVCRQFHRDRSETDEQYKARVARRMVTRRARNEIDLYNLPGGRWTLYDLRRTVATRLQQLGFDEGMVGTILAHAPKEKSATDLYARYGHWEMRCRALDSLGTALAGCESGSTPNLANNIIYFRKTL